MLRISVRKMSPDDWKIGECSQCGANSRPGSPFIFLYILETLYDRDGVKVSTTERSVCLTCHPVGVRIPPVEEVVEEVVELDAELDTELDEECVFVDGPIKCRKCGIVLFSDEDVALRWKKSYTLRQGSSVHRSSYICELCARMEDESYFKLY